MFTDLSVLIEKRESIIAAGCFTLLTFPKALLNKNIKQTIKRECFTISGQKKRACQKQI